MKDRKYGDNDSKEQINCPICGALLSRVCTWMDGIKRLTLYICRRCHAVTTTTMPIKYPSPLISTPKSLIAFLERLAKVSINPECLECTGRALARLEYLQRHYPNEKVALTSCSEPIFKQADCFCLLRSNALGTIHKITSRSTELIMIAYL